MKILIPAAGKGSRFLNSKYKLPKPNILVDDEPMLVKAAKKLGFRGQFIFLLQESPYRNDLVKKLYEAFPNCKVGVIDYITNGAAETAMLAEKIIDTEEELVIANCDQIMNWDYWNSDVALKQLRKYDAGLITVESNDPKHSYAKIENNLVVEVQEKNVISDIALTGIHYWKQGSDFVKSAKDMMADENFDASEYYVGPTYNYLIKDNKKVGVHTIVQNAIHFVGTPEDLEIYENRETV